LFGATFARYFAGLWQKLGAPAQWSLIESGAGNGLFAKSVLDALRRHNPNAMAGLRYIIDEISHNSLITAQAQVAGYGDHVVFRSLSELDAIDPGIIFSNELLDAFPVHRVIRQHSELCEFFVGLDGTGAFSWQTGKPSTERLHEYCRLGNMQLVEKQVAEINLGIEDWLRRVSAVLRRGYVVTVDYGAEAPDLYDVNVRSEGTLRAFRRHQFADNILADPGEQDITSSVNWTYVKRLGDRLGLETVGFERQDRFLLAAGLLEELELAVGAMDSEAARMQLREQARPMILPDGMAASFQVLTQEKGR